MTVVRPDTTSFAATLPRARASQPTLSTEGLGTGSIAGERTGESAPGADFGERVRDLLTDVNAQQVQAQQAATAYANGERNDLHGTMIALQKADITLRLVGNIRGRLVEAYREVMRMGA